MRWYHWGVIYLALLITSLAVVFGIVLPLVWRLQLGERPPSITLDTSFVLTAGLALLTLLASAFGVGTYRLLREEIITTAHMRSQRAIAVSLINEGLHYWNRYKYTRDNLQQPDYFYLNEAIDVTRFAYQDHASKLDESDRQNELPICIIRNNHAYYLAEKKAREQASGRRVTSGERDLALRYVDYIRKRLEKYPDHADEWSRTIAFVQDHFG